MTEIQEMNQLELQEMLESEGRPFAAFLYTPLCGTCKAARRMLEVAAHMLPGEFVLGSANVNMLPDIVNRYRISSVPALMVVSADRNSEPEIYYSMGSVERMLEYIRRVTS